MRNQISVLTLGLLCTLSITAQAADSLKPGQWEVTVKTSIKNGPAIDPIQVQTCITPEQASLENMAKQPSKDCKMQNFKHIRNKASGEMLCTGNIEAQGKFEMTLDSDTSYHATSSLKGTSKDGGLIDKTTDISGKWIKTNCDAAQK